MLKRWLMTALESSFGSSAKAPPPVVLPRTDYRAVSLVASVPACRAAEGCRGERTLLTGAPRLPLYECTMPGQCRCRFKMHADRRRDERRSPSVVWPRLKVMGLDRRRATGRRGSDIRC